MDWSAFASGNKKINTALILRTMDPFLLLPDETIKYGSKAIVNNSLLDIFATNKRIVGLNQANNIVFSIQFNKMQKIELIKATLSNKGVLKILLKEGGQLCLTTLNEANQTENKPEMNAWFNFIHQNLINLAMS